MPSSWLAQEPPATSPLTIASPEDAASHSPETCCSGFDKERYLPDPAVLGGPIVTFAFGHPYAEMQSRALATWRSHEGGDDVWAFKDAMFGVFFLRELQGVSALHELLGNPTVCRDIFFLDCDSREPTVPVFFDFEASWAQISGLNSTLAYPHSLPSAVRPGKARLQGFRKQTVRRFALC